MICTITAHTLRECLRRPLPYVAATAVIMLALASRALLAFTFGEEWTETANLILSAAFLAGFAQAAFQTTGLVRLDLESGIYGHLRATPLPLAIYLLGRYLGALLAAVGISATVAIALCVTLALLAHGVRESLQMLAVCPRVLLPLLVLEAAAIAASTVAQRVAAPLLVIVLFLGGSLAPGFPASLVLLDLGAFSLDAALPPPPAAAAAYALLYALIFLVLAFIVLTVRRPLRSQG